MSEITIDEFEKIYNSEDVEIIDIREENQLSQTDYGIIPGSKHIPYSDLINNLDKIDYNKNKIFIICRHGNSSLKAVRLLKSYEKSHSNIYSVKGGYLEWDGKLCRIKSICL